MQSRKVRSIVARFLWTVVKVLVILLLCAVVSWILFILLLSGIALIQVYVLDYKSIFS